MTDMEPLRWELPHGVHIAMSLAGDGDMRQAGIRSTWCVRWSLPEPAVLRQVHGCSIVTGRPTVPMAEADGLVVHHPMAAVGVFGADCPPLVVAAPDALGVAHCGWRGTAAGIVPRLSEALRAASRHEPSTWHALVGPGVHPDDFEVDAPVLSSRTWPAGSLRSGRPGRAWLDLPAAIAADCVGCGFASVARSAITTSREPRLRSHRRDGAGHPQLMLAWRTPCAG